jgi:LacI family transcriptional regulator, repressor for deo operon, udp, cdd, tsx, nupC, and nupG
MTARLTSHDVAARAGVSQSTVSLVLSGKARGRVSEALRSRVEAAAADLGYRPNFAGQALRNGRLQVVGLVVPDVTNPFFGAVLRGGQDAARAAGYTVALVEPGGDALNALTAGAMDGLVVFEPSPGIDADAPLVIVESASAEHPHVLLDVRAGARDAMTHLTDLGHRRIAHLAAAVDAPTFRLRREAWQAAAPGEAEARTPFELRAAHTAARELLRTKPTAVFCDDDMLAPGVYRAAREAGLRIPDDLSVVGFTGTLAADLLDPPLTTVVAPAAELGAAAVATLLARLAGEHPPHTTTLPVALRVAGSTAPCT